MLYTVYLIDMVIRFISVVILFTHVMQLARVVDFEFLQVQEFIELGMDNWD